MVPGRRAIVVVKEAIQRLFGLIITFEFIKLNHFSFQNAVKRFDISIFFGRSDVDESPGDPVLFDLGSFQKVTHSMGYELSAPRRLPLSFRRTTPRN